MRKLWIITLLILLTGCGGGIGNMNTGSFVATPVPDEIRIVTYSTQTSAGTRTWRLNNDDLRVTSTSKASDGRVVSSNKRKMTPNDYNWVVYNLEQANFTEAKSIPTSRQSFGNETLTVITQSNKYTYTQNGSAQFPNGFMKVVRVIPGLAEPR